MFLTEFSQKNSIIHFESINSLEEKMSKRTQRMAYARNRYLDIFKSLNREEKIKYLVVCDLNNLNNKLTLSSVRSCNNIDEWDALTANQDGPYYDIWALRHKYWNEIDCWERYLELSKLYKNKNRALWDSVYSKMIRISPKNPPIKVDSAFGGLAIYSTKYLKNCKYRGENSVGEQVCEHVAFHKQFTRNGGSLYINPALINFKYTDHSRRRKYFLMFNLKYLLYQHLKKVADGIMTLLKIVFKTKYTKCL